MGCASSNYTGAPCGLPAYERITDQMWLCHRHAESFVREVADAMRPILLGGEWPTSDGLLADATRKVLREASWSVVGDDVLQHPSYMVGFEAGKIVGRTQVEEHRVDWEDEPTHIYFAARGSFIKIGRSKRPQERVRNMSARGGVLVPHGEPTIGLMELLGIMDGVVADEKRVHNQFAHLRDVGEWFKDDPEIRQFIKDRCRQ